jgi:SAM-dependent methyltransferase
MNHNFQLYAEFYDALNSDKNYFLETQYLVNLIVRNKSEFYSALDIGCGTGKHAVELAKLGYKVVGIDSSEKMIELANRNMSKQVPELNLDFYLTDGKTFVTCEKFDVVYSLFHVMSYQTKNYLVKNFFNTAYDSLADGGLFIFDYWFKPGVLNLKPTLKVKTVDSGNFKITRFTTPHIANDSCTNVIFNFCVQDQISGSVENFKESHLMRSFIPSEFVEISGSKFDHIETYAWGRNDIPTDDTWAAISIFQKKDQL